MRWKRGLAWANWQRKRVAQHQATKHWASLWKRVPEGARLLIWACLVVAGLGGAGKLAGLTGDDIYKAGLLIGGLAGLFLAAKRTKTAQETARITQEGQITDRFSKAVEQLGHENVSIRIGAIYALKRIAQDSRERDFDAVFDVLSRFLRAPWPYVRQQRELLLAAKTQEDEALAQADGDKNLLDASDIITCIEILKEISKYKDQRAPGKICTLSGANLSFIYISGLNLESCLFINSNFSHSHTSNSKFTNCELKRLSFASSNIENTNFNNCDLTSSDMSRSSINGVSISGSTLQNLRAPSSYISFAEIDKCTGKNAIFRQSSLMEVNFTNCTLTRAIFSESSLESVSFTGCDLERSRFHSTHMEHSDFTNSNLKTAVFQGASLFGSEFRGTNLFAANFRDSTLDMATFLEAEVSRADFSGASLNGTNFDGAWYAFGHPPKGLPPEILGVMKRHRRAKED